jgi:hypothetical protein
MPLEYYSIIFRIYHSTQQIMKKQVRIYIEHTVVHLLQAKY